MYVNCYCITVSVREICNIYSSKYFNLMYDCTAVWKIVTVVSYSLYNLSIIVCYLIQISPKMMGLYSTIPELFFINLTCTIKKSLCT